MPTLTVLDGAKPGDRLSLDAIETGRTKIIRTSERRAGMPEIHVRRSEHGWHIEPNAERAVRVNGREPAADPLVHGDLVKAGSLVLIFSEDDEVVPSGEARADPFESEVDLRVEPEGSISDVLRTAAADERPDSRGGELLAFSAALARANVVADVLALAAERSQAALAADRGLAVLLRRDRRGPRAAEHCVRDGAPEGPPLRISRTVVEEVIASGQTVGSVDRVPGNSDLVRSALCAPVVAGGDVIGLLHVDICGRIQAFGARAARRLAALGHLTGGALASARAATERERHGRRLRALATATRRLSSVLRRDAVVAQASAMAAAILNCKRASVLLRDDAGQLRVAGGTGLPETLTGQPVEGDTGVAALVVKGRRPLRVTDTDAPGAPRSLAKGRYRSRSYLAVPILARGVDTAEAGAVVGVFCATERFGDRPFTSSDGDLLAVIASATGAALVAADLREALALDKLTGVASRAYLDARLAQEVRIARGGGLPLCVIMIDLDEFKRVNDEFGHGGGDTVLACVGQTLNRELRGDDVAARYGGDEFIVLLPGAGTDEATAVAERMRQEIEEATRSLGEGRGVTVSVGVTQWDAGDDPSVLLAKVDDALYASKRGGRGRVTTVSRKPGS
jgi:diguanylate cyclase (GGDEF)-like protein